MKLLSLFIISFIGIRSYAQGDSTGKPVCPLLSDCSHDLTKPLAGLGAFTSITTGAVESYAKTGAVPTNFHDVSYAAFSPYCTLPNACIQNEDSLKYQAFYPTVYKSCNLPVVIFFHGGGFLDCNGNFATADIQTICKEFAQRGFVAISVGYRLGAEVLKGSNTYYTTEQMLAIWRAGQDARGAIRSIIYREQQSEKQYHINVNQIFLAGNSAGSVVAMNVAYYNLNTMLASAFPGGINSTSILGTINQNYYYGPVTTPYSIAGVLDLWGGVLLPHPYDSTGGGTNPPENFFFQTNNNMPPVIAFCGENDLTFNPTTKPLVFPPASIPFYQADYISTNNCLNDQTGATYYALSPSVSYGNVLGSQNIYEMFQRKNIYSEFYLDCQMEHGLDDDCGGCGSGKSKDANNNCITCFNSEFGTGLSNQASVNLYIVQRACVFFQNVINGKTKANFPVTKFVECANLRNSCANIPAPACYSDINFINQICPSSVQP